MKLKDVMSKDLRTIEPEATLREAAATMNKEGIGMLPVMGLAKMPMGVITDRDIALRGFLGGLTPESLVREAMTSPVYSLDQDRDLDAALAFMTTARVRRILVCDERGHLTGVFSLADAELCCSDSAKVAAARRALSTRVHHVQASGVFLH